MKNDDTDESFRDVVEQIVEKLLGVVLRVVVEQFCNHRVHWIQ